MDTSSRKDQLTKLQTEYDETQNRINQSKHNCEVVLHETLQIASETAQVLDEQTEQIDRIIKKTVIVDKTLHKAETIISKMESWFRSIFNIGHSTASTISYDKDFPEPIQQQPRSQPQDTNDELETRYESRDQSRKHIGRANGNDDDDSQFLENMNKGLEDLKQMAIKQGEVLDYHNYMLPQINETVDRQNYKIRKLQAKTSTLAK